MTTDALPPELRVEDPEEEKPWQDKEKLEKAYHDEDLTQEQIADLWETSQMTISNWVGKHDIKSRDPVEAQQAVHGEKPWHDEEILRDFWDEHETATGVAEAFDEDVTPTTIRKWLDRYEIRETSSDEKKPWQKEGVLRGFLEEGYSEQEIADELGCDQSTISRWIKRFDLRPDYRKEDVLRELHEEGLGQVEIAEELDAKVRHVSYWMWRYGIIESDERVMEAPDADTAESADA